MNFFFLTALLLICACTKSGKKENILSISLTGDISTLDPANCYDTVCYVPVAQIYEPLYEIEYLKRPYTLRPLLAESMPIVSTNQLKYTFKIKRGIKYHASLLIPEGREVKSRDFIMQLKRLAYLGTNSRGWWLFDGKIKGLNDWRKSVKNDFERFFTEPIAGIYALDDYTFSIELIRPYPQLIYAMAMSFTAPLPEEAVRAAKNDFQSVTMGTGPYIVTDYNSNQGVSLEKNEHYISSTYPVDGDRFAHEKNLLKDANAKLPFIKKIRLHVIKESQTDWFNFLKQKTDILNLTTDHSHAALTADGKLKPEIAKDNISLQTSPTLIYWWLSFNMKDPVLGKNLNLRKAIAHGINIDKFIELFTYKIAQKANSIYPPGIAGYTPSTELPYKYDLALAKEYLAKSGYPEGKKLPHLQFDTRGTDTIKRQMGEFIQQELKNIGIIVDVNTNSFPTFLEKSRKGELQFWQGGWVMDYPDSENVLQLLSSSNLPPGPNSSQYVNAEFDSLFEKLKEMRDGPEKTDLMRKMERIVNDDLPWIMQYYTRNYILYHHYLENFRYSDIIYNGPKYLKIK